VRTHASSCIGETSLQNQEIHFLQCQYGHYAITPLHHYTTTAITPLRQYGHYAITPLRHYAITPVRPLRQYASTPLRHYAITPVRPLHHYASMSITALCQYLHYSHYAITPLRPLCHSPHSLASLKDMYVEMGFPLNLYRQQQILCPACYHRLLCST
jgi:hypothetical protein